MKRQHRARTAVLLVLALLAGLPGVLGAACGPICPSAAQMAASHSCCLPAAAPSLKAGSCCEKVQAAAPSDASRAAVSPPSPTVLALAAPLALPAEPLVERATPEPPALPPPLHEGVGLYTLHSVFLI